MEDTVNLGPHSKVKRLVDAESVGSYFVGDANKAAFVERHLTRSTHLEVATQT